MKTPNRLTFLWLMCWSILYGLLFHQFVNIDSTAWDDPDNTKWEYTDCGRVILTDRTEEFQTQSSSAPHIDYFVTYYSEYHGKNRTLDVTPGAYSLANEYKVSGKKICFSIYAGGQGGLQMYSIFLVLMMILCTIMLIVHGLPLYIKFKKSSRSNSHYY